jgi:hypothetical protein
MVGTIGQQSVATMWKEEVLFRNLSGVTEETVENVGSVAVERFVRWTVRAWRLVVIAVNAEGNDEARQDSNPSPSDNTDLFCACLRITMTSWGGDLTCERPRQGCLTEMQTATCPISGDCRLLESSYWLKQTGCCMYHLFQRSDTVFCRHSVCSCFK